MSSIMGYYGGSDVFVYASLPIVPPYLSLVKLPHASNP